MEHFSYFNKQNLIYKIKIILKKFIKTTILEYLKENNSISFGEKRIETDFAIMEGYYGNELEAEEMIKLPFTGLLITGVYLKDMSNKGYGHGQEIYLKALNEYKVLYSTFPVSDDALNVQNRLMDKGLINVDFVDLGDISFRILTLC